MNNFGFQAFVISTCASLGFFTSCDAAAQTDAMVQKSQARPPLLGQPSKRHVTINEQKFELLSRQADHWLLFDPQSGQYCITLNQLVVVTTDLKFVLNQAGWSYNAKEWELLAKDTYRWSGPFTQLLQLRQKLKAMPDTKIEWQLQYLPLSKQAEI